MIHSFLTHLHRAGAYAYFHALPERRSWWYETGKPLAPPEECTSNWYFGVHPTSAIPPTNARGEVRPPCFVRAQKQYVAAVNCLFAEFDTKDYGTKSAILSHLADWPTPYPSVLVDSGGGIHAYWLLTEPFTLDSDDRREAARIIQDLWVSAVKGDPGAKDITRVLRVPGSINFKYDPPRSVQFLTCNLDRTYALPQLTAFLPPVRESFPPLPNAPRRHSTIQDYNAATDIGDLLERRGYTWCGRYKMLSPNSSTGQAGVTIDTADNRAFVHHGSDPLHDGYWKRPFDVVKILDFDGDFERALAAIRRGDV